MKVLGGLLFILGSSLGAYLLVCNLYPWILFLRFIGLITHLIQCSCLSFAASPSGNCYTNLIRLLQLWCRQDRICSTFCQVHRGLQLKPVSSCPCTNNSKRLKSDWTYCCFLAEFSTVWSIALLHWNEEFNAKKATQEEGGSQSEDRLRREWFAIWMLAMLMFLKVIQGLILYAYIRAVTLSCFTVILSSFQFLFLFIF